MRARFCAIPWLLLLALPVRAAVPPPSEPSPTAASGRPSLASLFSEDRDNYFITRVPGVTGDGNADVKFQLSTNFDVFPNQSPVTVYIGYTQKSLWRMWDFSKSSPLQDTNYNPSLAIAFRAADSRGGRPHGVPGIHFYWARLLAEHESNGVAGPTSRSWNRISAASRFGVYFTDRLYFILQPKVWWPFVDSSLDSDGGGNPTLIQYTGYGELRVECSLDSAENGSGYAQFVLGAVLRKGTKFLGSGEFWLRWRTPFRALSTSLYLQYFGGYDETLLSFDHFSNSLRIGVALGDFFPSESKTPMTSTP